MIPNFAIYRQTKNKKLQKNPSLHEETDFFSNLFYFVLHAECMSAPAHLLRAKDFSIAFAVNVSASSSDRSTESPFASPAVMAAEKVHPAP